MEKNLPNLPANVALIWRLPARIADRLLCATRPERSSCFKPRDSIKKRNVSLGSAGSMAWCSCVDADWILRHRGCGNTPRWLVREHGLPCCARNDGDTGAWIAVLRSQSRGQWRGGTAQWREKSSFPRRRESSGLRAQTKMSCQKILFLIFKVVYASK